MQSKISGRSQKRIQVYRGPWPRRDSETTQRTWLGMGQSFRQTGRLDFPDFLHEIAKGDRSVLESMSKVVDLRDRPSPSHVFALID